MEQSVILSDQANRNKIECVLLLRTCSVKDEHKDKDKVRAEEAWGKLVPVVIHTFTYIHVEHL
jgi:hypothetical protein